MPELQSTSGRAADLDLLKTILVVGMIGAHVIELITRAPAPEAQAFAFYIDLISFSGFMFAFGIGVGLPAGTRKTRTAWSRVRPVLLLLLATYVSELAFVVLVDRQRLMVPLVIDLLTLTRLFGWSEFLATFFVLYALIAVARPVLVRIGQSPILLIAVSALCLAGTLLVSDAPVPVLAAIIGTTRFASFPLLAYLPWFLLGIWYGSRPLRLWQVIPAAAATLGFWFYMQRFGAPPSRFPPSALWVIAPAAPLLIYLFVSRAVAAGLRIPRALLVPGRHVLSFLVLSNLIIFTTRHLEFRPLHDTAGVALAATAIIIGISLLWLVVEGARRRSRT
jgi:hypothetical protein